MIRTRNRPRHRPRIYIFPDYQWNMFDGPTVASRFFFKTCHRLPDHSQGVGQGIVDLLEGLIRELWHAIHGPTYSVTEGDHDCFLCASSSGKMSTNGLKWDTNSAAHHMFFVTARAMLPIPLAAGLMMGERLRGGPRGIIPPKIHLTAEDSHKMTWRLNKASNLILTRSAAPDVDTYTTSWCGSEMGRRESTYWNTHRDSLRYSLEPR
jgi:hypothetical protein